jgi:phosphoadenosine phosphosulfate reductase
MTLDLDTINRELGQSPEALVRWGCEQGGKVIATTNFGPFAAVVLDLVTQQRPDVPILWVDSGYGTPAMYRFADDVTRLLHLNLHIYHPRRSRAHREAVEGAPPSIDDPRHGAFTEEVKLEPFARAMRDLNPDVWFTAIRKEQTAFRAGLQPVTHTKEGVLKISPVFHWTSKQMHEYLKARGLPNNFDYFDPTKVEDKRECGLHLAH